MLTLDQPQHQTPNGVAPSPPHRVAPAPSPSAPATTQTPEVSPHFVSPSPSQQQVLSVSSLLLDPETDPIDIAQNHNLPLDTILDIFESEEVQTHLQRIERMQARRAEFHLSTAKPLAARNLTLLLEASLAEESNRASRETEEAATLRCRQRETTRKVATAILRSSTAKHTPPSPTAPPGTPPDTADSASIATGHLKRESTRKAQAVLRPPRTNPSESRGDEPPCATSPDQATPCPPIYTQPIKPRVTPARSACTTPDQRAHPTPDQGPRSPPRHAR